MTMALPNTSGAQMALTMLSAQASASGARAAISQTNVQIGATADGAVGTGGYDINTIAESEFAYQSALTAEGRARSEYVEKMRAGRRRDSWSQHCAELHRKRAAAMMSALKKLGAGPLPEGQRMLSLFTGAGGNALSIFTTGRVESLYRREGDQALAIKAQTVDGIYTGGGNDAVAIDADWVESVRTDRDAEFELALTKSGKPYARYVSATESNDAVVINARRVEDVTTGGGNDAIAIRADMIRDVDAGDGRNSITLSGGIIGEVGAGDGSDAITVDAAIGLSALPHLRSDYWGSRPDPTWQRYDRPGSAEERLMMAVTRYSDVYAGGGNDTIAVTVQEVFSIDGGSGNDVISIGGGTVGLHVGKDAGNDVVQVAKGAELLIQIDGAGEYTLETDGADLIVHHEGGSVRVVGYENAAAIGIGLSVNANNRREPPFGADDTVYVAGEDRNSYEYEGLKHNRYLHMIHIAQPEPLDIML